jgi:hypothetical protein
MDLDGRLFHFSVMVLWEGVEWAVWIVLDLAGGGLNRGERGEGRINGIFLLQLRQ